MIRRVATAVGIALALTAWSGPAHAWAPKKKKKPVPVIEVGAAPEVEEGVDEGVEPGVDESIDEGMAPEVEEGGGEAEIDPLLDEGDAPIEPATADAEEGTDPPTSPTDVPAPSTPNGTHDVPADDFEAEAGLAPGGYHGHGVILERAPPDGRNRIIVGSILVPLGTLATITSAVGTWMTVPAHCAERLSGIGIEATADRCQGLFAFNVIRTSYGALMLGSGATILVLGMLQREKYRKWRNEHGMRARFEPAIGLPGRGTASLGLRVRF
jgi:hypothetical protein